MSKKLIDTNPYLQDKELRLKLTERSVRTSCGVEGIRVSPRRKLAHKISRQKGIQSD